MTVPRALSSVDLQDRAQVGSKAAVLGVLLARGLPVPPGYVIADASSVSELPPLPEGESLIVRSSASVEDGVTVSFAGQFESIGGVRTRRALLAAIRKVSRPGRRARSYANRLGIGLPERIPVLVQRQIPAASAGVLFTVDPLGREPGAFALGWGAGAAITDGAPGEFRTFDPFDLRSAAIADPVVARALPALVDLSFAALRILSAERPLDLEWIVDPDGRPWIVQARPVTTPGPGGPAVEALVAQGWLLVSPRPASRLALHHYRVAGAADRSAARFHHAHFERRIESGWLLVRRIKSSPRGSVAADDPFTFALRWLGLRRRNLAFAAAQLARWSLVRRSTERWAARALSVDLRDLSARRLSRLLRDSLRAYDRVRAVHAALWYPVDLAGALESFEQLFGWPGLAASLPPPPRRSTRDRETARLLLRIRRGHGGAHPPWEHLSPPDREAVLAHLIQFPYAFGCAAEVQDLAEWCSWVEEPQRWWGGQASSSSAELERLLASSRGSSRPPPPSSLGIRIVGAALRKAVAPFAALKDDRVELLALAASALRCVLVEVERRAGGPASDRGWIFELDPSELLSLGDRPGLRELAIQRSRRRLLARFHSPRPSARPEPTVDSARGGLPGLALSAGSARGRACVVASADEARRLLRQGEVLVTPEIRPAFTAVLPRAGALVCRRASPLSHAAIVARELHLPAVSLEELDRIENGALLLVDGDRGSVALEV